MRCDGVCFDGRANEFTRPRALAQMNTHEFISALQLPIPSFAVVEGCYLLTRYAGNDEHVRGAIDRSRRALEANGLPNDVLGYTEQLLNRTFVISDLLDEFDRETDFSQVEWQEAVLQVADVFASLVRRGLGGAFPDVAFDVTVEGQGGVEDEPLEVYVTFSRTSCE